MRARLIANPESGSDRAIELIPLIHERLRSRYDEVDITITAGPADAGRAAALALAEQCAALYIAGGDGTVNAALRGMHDWPSAQRLPIGVIPLGTGNDFAKALGLGEEAEPALDLLLNPRVIDVDVGLMNDVPFINTSAGGFIAEVSDVVTPSLKDIAGKLAYLIGGARALMTTEPFRMRLLMAADSTSAVSSNALASAAELDVQLFAVCNARFIGGGYAIAPAAVIDDGLLDVLVVPRMSFIEFVAVLQRIAAARDPGRDDVLQFRGTTFTFEFDRAVLVNVDGEVLEARRCDYRIHQRHARFFCGHQPHATARPVAFAAR